MQAKLVARFFTDRFEIVLPLLLVVGFLLALLLRVAIGGTGVSVSPIAGLVFAGVLLSFVVACRLTIRLSLLRVLAVGTVGAIVLCLPTVVQLTSTHSLPAGNYATWVTVVTIVAVAEEAFLRGVLFDALSKWRGMTMAVIVGALLFAILHIPLYGWESVPLNFVVGLWLGALRATAGSWVAPAISHSVADALSWWFL